VVAASLADDLELPEAPGLSESNLVVKVTTDLKNVKAKSGSMGVEKLMQQSSATILGLMSRDGWQVNEIDGSKGLFEILMPPVSYSLPLGQVSIPAPRFLCTVHDSDAADGDCKERLVGDLILQNGAGIFNVELRFFSKQFSIDAAGWARCKVCSCNENVRMAADVQVGMQVPKVPGLSQIMEFFVKRYADESTNDCARALATGADEMSEK